MSTLVLTMVLAATLVVLAIALLGIGYLITGKSNLRAGACGRDPHKKQNEECGTNTTCSLCEKEDKK